MVSTCNACQRSFNTVKGRNIHYSRCLKNGSNVIIEHESENLETENSSVEIEINLIVDIDELNIEFTENEDKLSPNLPSYQKEKLVPDRKYNTLDGNELVEIINKVYDDVITWRKNLFLVPTGKLGKDFIILMTYWLEQFNNNSDFKCIALKTFMILPSLFIQKPSKNSKVKDHIQKLQDRFELWNNCNIAELHRQGQTIQRKLTSSKRTDNNDIAKVFARLILQGNVNAAMRHLTDNSDQGLLPVTDVVINELKKKHPDPAPIQSDILLHGPLEQVPSNYFDRSIGSIRFMSTDTPK